MWTMFPLIFFKSVSHKIFCLQENLCALQVFLCAFISRPVCTCTHSLKVQNKPYTFTCIDYSRAIYRSSIKLEVRNTEVRYTEVLLYRPIWLISNLMYFEPLMMVP